MKQFDYQRISDLFSAYCMPSDQSLTPLSCKDLLDALWEDYRNVNRIDLRLKLYKDYSYINDVYNELYSGLTPPYDVIKL